MQYTGTTMGMQSNGMQNNGMQNNGMRNNGMQNNGSFVQTNLVSDGSVAAANTDSNLVNPWGLAASPTGPFWVADNGTGVTTLYDGAGNPKMAGGNSAITIAAPPGQASPAAPPVRSSIAREAGSMFRAAAKAAPSPLSLRPRMAPSRAGSRP
jgi:hypothetical protein